MNPPSSAGPGDRRDRAEDLYLERVGESGHPDASVVDTLCREHPELAAELREVDEELRRGLAAVSPRAAAPTPAGIGERYAVLREIDAGGMGVVFEVWDHTLRRRLAMKLVRGDRGRGSSTEWHRCQSMLRNEARVLGRLVHPGIVPVHDVGQTADGTGYFTMQLVRGRHLGELIETAHAGDRDWSTARLLGVLQRVCEAMAHAHAEGVVHRDLKPSNIMVGPFGEAYVLDWGLARAVRGAVDPAAGAEDDAGVAADDARVDETLAEASGAVVGTPSYMSPEQARGAVAEVDARSDVYSMGAILYELLTGRRPFADASSAADVLRAVRERGAAPLADLGRDVPAELAAIAECAMHPEPARRYRSMAEMASDLRAFLEGRVVHAHRTGAWIELRKWVGRNRSFAAALLLLFVATAAFAVHQASSNRELRRRDYRNKVALAGHAVERGDVRTVKALLESCPPDLRGWEWHAIRRLADTSDVTLRVHRDQVSSVAISPDGARVASGCRGGLLCVADAADGSVLWTRSFDQPIYSVAFRGADAVLLAVGGRVVEARSGDSADGYSDAVADRELELTIAVSPDGARVLIGGAHGRVEVWQAAPLRRESVLVDGLYGVSQVGWTPDGRLALVAGRDRHDDGLRASRVRVYDADSGELVQALEGHSHWVGSVAASPSGRRLASSDWDGHVRIWSLPGGEPEHVLPSVWPGSVPLGWLDEDRLVVGGRASLQVWAVASTEPPLELTGHEDAVSSLAVRGGTVVSASRDTTVRIWRVGRSGRRVEVPSHGTGRGLAVRPGASQLAVSAFAGQVELWNVARRELAATTPIPSRRAVIAWTRAGDRLLVGDMRGRLEVRDPASGGVVREVQAHDDQVADVAVHPTLPRCVTAGSDGRVRSWELDTLAPGWTIRAGLPVWPHGAHECAYSPDGTSIAVGANDERLRIVDADTGAVLRELRFAGAGHTFGTPAFSPDGRVVVARVWGRASRLVAWDARDGRVLWSRGGGRFAFNGALFLAGGTRVVTGSDDGQLLVLDAATGTALVTLPAPTPRHLTQIAAWGDVVIGATEHSLRFWDGRPLASR